MQKAPLENRQDKFFGRFPTTWVEFCLLSKRASYVVFTPAKAFNMLKELLKYNLNLTKVQYYTRTNAIFCLKPYLYPFRYDFVYLVAMNTIRGHPHKVNVNYCLQ